MLCYNHFTIYIYIKSSCYIHLKNTQLKKDYVEKLLSMRYWRLTIIRWKSDKAFKGFVASNYPQVSLVCLHSKLPLTLPLTIPTPSALKASFHFLFCLLTGPESLWSSDVTSELRSLARYHQCKFATSSKKKKLQFTCSFVLTALISKERTANFNSWRGYKFVILQHQKI